MRARDDSRIKTEITRGARRFHQLFDDTNRVELRGVGTAIGALNDVEVASAQDDLLTAGRSWIAVYGSGITMESRFDNLVLAEVRR